MGRLPSSMANATLHVNEMHLLMVAIARGMSTYVTASDMYLIFFIFHLTNHIATRKLHFYFCKE